jgi:flagellar biogenesis protein FliO
MPVDAIQPYQIIIMVVFLLLLVAALIIVRRFRGGLSKHIHRTKRMHHVEEMALSPQQRLHLVEVDGQVFMIHAGKGHAATVVPVAPMGSVGSVGQGVSTASRAPNTPNTSNTMGGSSAPMNLTDVQRTSRQAQAASQQPQQPQQPSRRAEVADETRSSANVDQIANAIAEARRRNPSLGLDK